MDVQDSEIVKMPDAKRVFDVAVSFVLIILSFPLWTLIILLLSIEQIFRLNFPMPIYYEKRVSLGRPFSFYKFNIFKPRVVRSYYQRGEHIFTKKLEHDGHSPTWVGQLVQKTYLDELPQLWCILIGNMSLVGPRPRDIVQYEKGLSQGNKALAVIKAGLAGTYQANKGVAGANQYNLDMQYIEYVRTHNSWQILKKDIKIIIGTIRIMLRAQGY